MKRPATISVQAASRREWDVVVVGAGPAGSLAARQAAASQLRTLLIDRANFPRDKVCGGCLSGRALSVLRGVGLAALAERTRAASIHRLHLHACRQHLRVSLPEAAFVDRSEFDSALVEAAIEAGACFLPGTTGRIGEAGTVRRVALAQRGREITSLQTRIVLSASGLQGISRDSRPEFLRRVWPGAHVGVNARVAARGSAYRYGAVYMGAGRDGYVGVVLQPDGRLNVAGALAPDFLRRAAHPSDAVGRIINESGLPRITALGEGHWKGTGPLTHVVASPASERVFVLGDAAGYVEPFTGEGMAWALHSAIAVTPLVRRAVKAWTPDLAREWVRATSHFRREQRACRVLARLLRRRTATAVSMALLRRFPPLADYIARRIHSLSKEARLECLYSFPSAAWGQAPRAMS